MRSTLESRRGRRRVAERGIERNELINSAQPVARAAVGELLGRYDRVWYW